MQCACEKNVFLGESAGVVRRDLNDRLRVREPHFGMVVVFVSDVADPFYERSCLCEVLEVVFSVELSVLDAPSFERFELRSDRLIIQSFCHLVRTCVVVFILVDVQRYEYAYMSEHVPRIGGRV